jgi:hypothetical protein
MLLDRRKKGVQRIRIFGRRSGDRKAQIKMMQGVLLLLLAVMVGYHLPIWLQQIIKADNLELWRSDPQSIHARSVASLMVIAVAIGFFAGKAQAWLLKKSRLRTVSVALGLFTGFAAFNGFAKAATGSDFYTVVIAVLGVTAVVTAWRADGYRRLRLSNKPRATIVT